MLRTALVGIALSFCCAAQDWSIERLFSQPYLQGTSPLNFSWSRRGHTLVFLWNAEGRRTMDLYAYHPDQGKLARLTDLAAQKDELNQSPEETDPRLRPYLPVPLGLVGYDLAADGSRVAFGYQGELYIVGTGGASPPFRLTRTKTVEGGAQFSPDGKLLAFVRAGVLYVQNLSNSQLWQATDIEPAAGRLAGYRWSPDGRYFVCMLQRGAPRQMVMPNYSGRFVEAPPFYRSVAGDMPPETTFFVVPSEGGKAQPLETGTTGRGEYLWFPMWSPDSTRLLLRITQPGMKKHLGLVIDRASGKSRVVYETSDPKWVNSSEDCWSPDSREVLFSSERDGWAHLYRVSAEGGQAVQLTRGAYEIRADRFGLEPQWVGEYIYYPSTEVSSQERHFYRMRRDGSGQQRLSRREGMNIGLVSADGAHIAWQWANLTNPFDLWVDDRRVTTSPRPEFYQYEWPQTRFVQFASKGDGKMVAAKMLLPPGYRPEARGGKRWPAVVFSHGAGYATSVLKQWGSYNSMRYLFNCYLAHRGYVVMDIDYRGSSGYGRDWRTDVYLNMGPPELSDILGGVQYLGGLGNIDMHRLGIWGGSHGGFLTNFAMFQAPDTFRAGVAWGAVNDWENDNPFFTTERLSTPEQHPEAYRRSSAIHFSSLLKNPLLIVHAMADTFVTFQDAVQLTEKLIHEGKHFSHIYYPEENHSFVRDDIWIDAVRRTSAWFDRYLP